jgi:ribosomal protein L24
MAKIKKGDTVIVITGRSDKGGSKGKTGLVLNVEVKQAAFLLKA